MKKKIVLGVTGGIAAYKAADLCSKLTQNGCEVHVIMTAHAVEFITPLTFQTLSRNPVITGLFENHEWKPEHVNLADDADMAVVAPATVNIIGKYVSGIADDALSTFLATFRKKLYMAPAMNNNMLNSPVFQRNLNTLKELGVTVIPPETGYLACGTNNTGRMAEPATILQLLLEN